MKKRIAVLTTNRSEYGLLKNVIIKLQKRDEIITDVLVSGTHLEPKWGNTVREIENDMINNLKYIKISSLNQEKSVSQVMAETIYLFEKYFKDNQYAMLIVLGDRYETFAVCIAALNLKIPISHIHGGEISEGALDNYYRNCITKMSYLHFTSLIEYRNRVIQLGEAPERVFCVGALGVENIKNTQLLQKQELEKTLNFILDKPYALVTYHPVSMESEDNTHSIKELLKALDEEKNFKFILTFSNSDEGGSKINQILERYASEREQVLVVKSLGSLRYLSALKYASMVIGNSSSGIIEAPSFHIPIVNIGKRQKGRIHSPMVINCDSNREAILTAIQKAKYMLKSGELQRIFNPYEQVGTASKIVDILIQELGKEIDLKKEFYDIDGKKLSDKEL